MDFERIKGAKQIIGINRFKTIILLLKTIIKGAEQMNKKVYIITNYDNDYSKAVSMSEEQAKAINWFIDLADLNYSCQEPTDTNCEEI